MPYSSRKMIRLLGPAGVCLALAACAAPGPGAVVVGHEPTHMAPGLEPAYVDWNDHTDKVSLHGGDAVAFNRHVQYENPWPRYQNRTHIHMDGDRADLAIDRYKAGAVKQPEAPDSTSGSGTQ